MRLIVPASGGAEGGAEGGGRVVLEEGGSIDCPFLTDLSVNQETGRV